LRGKGIEVRKGRGRVSKGDGRKRSTPYNVITVERNPVSAVAYGPALTGQMAAKHGTNLVS